MFAALARNWKVMTGTGAAGLALVASLGPLPRAPLWAAPATSEVCCTLAVGEALFKSECVVCHGKGGKGDGPVAVAMKPRPTDLTDTTRMARLSDDSLASIVTHGRGAMPSFKDDLSADQIAEVVAYIRTLKP